MSIGLQSAKIYLRCVWKNSVMADFKTHMMGAAVVNGIMATGLVMTGTVSDQAVVGYFCLGVMGGLLPDIDSDTSIPLRMAFNVLAVIAGFLAVFTFGRQYSLVELTLLWLACFVGIRYGVFSVFTGITEHRGLFHSIPAGLLFGLATVLVVYYVFNTTTLHAWICGFFVLIGFLVHLLLDEFYSVNLMGMELKSSFGSAFNLGSLRNPYGTLSLYLVIMGLFYLAPSPDAFVRFILNGDIHRHVIERLLPHHGWFNGLFKVLFTA